MTTKTGIRYHRDASLHYGLFDWNALLRIFRVWHENRELTWALTKREVLQRYRGSMLGLCWAVLNPIVLLLIYTVVFSTIMKASWNEDMKGFGIFAIMLYCGLIPYNFFCETMSSSTRMITDKPNYVCRIAFPLEILPLVLMGNGLIHALIAIGILLVGILLVVGHIPWTVVLLPIVWIPFIINCLSLSFLLSTMSTFLRDLQQLISIVLLSLFFVTPIFYSSDKVEPGMRWLLFINPVANVAANTRKVCVYGLVPDWQSWLLFTGASCLLLFFVVGWFQIIRKRFPDVV